MCDVVEIAIYSKSSEGLRHWQFGLTAKPIVLPPLRSRRVSSALNPGNVPRELPEKQVATQRIAAPQIKINGPTLKDTKSGNLLEGGYASFNLLLDFSQIYPFMRSNNKLAANELNPRCGRGGTGKLKPL